MSIIGFKELTKEEYVRLLLNQFDKVCLPLKDTRTGMTNENGMYIYRCDGKPHIPYKWWRLRCRHQYEPAKFHTGYAYFDDAYTADVCIHCGKRINWEQTY